MDVREVVATRRAVRAFCAKPVPYDIVHSVLDEARQAPSGCNYQPWEAVVVTGEPLRKLHVSLATADRQDPIEYVIHPPDLPIHYKGRLEDAMRPVYQAAGIDRSDLVARKAFQERNRFGFGAPALLLCFVPRYMGPPQWGDVGMWLQTVMLLLRAHGLDSCAQGYVSYFARLIKEHVGISDETHVLYCGLAIGYRDEMALINNVPIKRIELQQQVRFLGFDDAPE